MHGIRAMRREKALTKPLETGTPPGKRAIVMDSGVCLKCQAHHINRRAVRARLAYIIMEYAYNNKDEDEKPVVVKKIRKAKPDKMTRQARRCRSAHATVSCIFFD